MNKYQSVHEKLKNANIVKAIKTKIPYVTL